MSDDVGRLVGDASRGDAEAVDELLARYLAPLRAYVRGRMGGLPAGKEAPSDVVQSACREVLEHLADERLTLRTEAEFREWLFRAALYKLNDRRRFWGRARRDPRREERADRPSRVDDFFRSLATPSREADANEELRRVARAFEELPPRYRDALRLARVEGLSHREIADRLGVNEGASRMLLSRAAARLARLLARGP